MKAFAPVARPALRYKLRSYYQLTKPRVVFLVVFCAVVGMFLAVPHGVPDARVLLAGTLGIALVAGAAAAVNCLVEQKTDAVMERTRHRPLPRGDLAPFETLLFSGMIGGLGLSLLNHYANALTMWLTLATFVGYAVIYTVILKPNTSQNIVIGGATGAMPPVLGWVAVTGDVTFEPVLLFLIIFIWTPPHFWSLALYRAQDYARAGLPMLPVKRGAAYTQRCILAYTAVLVVVSTMPLAIGMSGVVYGSVAMTLGAGFLIHAVGLNLHYSDALARRSFRYSIVYLALLFAALLLDHYLRL